MILRQNVRSRQVLLLGAGLLVVTIATLLFAGHGSIDYTKYTTSHPSANAEKSAGVYKPAVNGTEHKMHLLLPASNPDVNMCKTLLTASVLGYPTPTLIAWQESFDQGHLLGGGSHVAKISGVLKYLEDLDSSADDDLVLMMDAYDIWFQLRKETFVERYYAINEQANKRIEERLGSAVEKEDIKQTIIFGAGKRCAPNQVHTVACYPIPDSPLPDDLYGANTDTIMGRNKYTSLKQRYLNSGYIIGPAKDMRLMFRRAWEKVEATEDQMPYDNGSGGSDFMYHGSDQSIFNTMLGEQEYQREVMRRRHRSKIDKVRGTGAPRQWYLEGTLIDDVLDPSFTHEPIEHKDGKPDEFGMGLDYFSELGQQTVNSEQDARYIQYSLSIPEQAETDHLMFDCDSRVDGSLPADILASTGPLAGLNDADPARWRDVPLYTNICLNTVPAMIHHNGAKEAREEAWPTMWVQRIARQLMAVELEKAGSRAGGAVVQKDGAFVAWGELCPAEMEPELFRDVEWQAPEDGEGEV